MIGSSHCRRAKSPLGIVLIINLLGKGLTGRWRLHLIGSCRRWYQFLFLYFFIFVLLLLLLFCLIINFDKNYFIILFFYFFMFRNVPACSGMFRVPGFIDAPFHKHANSKVQKPPPQLRFPLPSIIITIPKHTKRIEIHQAPITNHDLKVFWMCSSIKTPWFKNNYMSSENITTIDARL